MQREKSSHSDSPTKNYLSPAPDKAGIYLKVILQPGASKEMIVGPYQGSLKVKVNSRPVEGAANKNLVALISKSMHVAKSSIVIKQGKTSRSKVLLIKGITMNEADKYIDAVIAKSNR
ncbi:hypothetical protein MNBD_GAMMA09-201 [hydrothermal vent metagenome]|uniref:COG1872 n=1 Tax=hydrothermal vent metagenome TaxID=652676 RepID=A0A3B0XLB5_9ZZZZ